MRGHLCFHKFGEPKVSPSSHTYMGLSLTSGAAAAPGELVWVMGQKLVPGPQMPSSPSVRMRAKRRGIRCIAISWDNAKTTLRLLTQPPSLYPLNCTPRYLGPGKEGNSG